MNTIYGVFMAICRIDAQGDSLYRYACVGEPARPLNDAHLAGVVLLGFTLGKHMIVTIGDLGLRFGGFLSPEVRVPKILSERDAGSDR